MHTCAISNLKQKEKNKKKDAELGEEVDEEHDELHEELDAVEVFKDFHTSRKKGLSDTAREAIVSTFICFP